LRSVLFPQQPQPSLSYARTLPRAEFVRLYRDRPPKLCPARNRRKRAGTARPQTSRRLGRLTGDELNISIPSPSSITQTVADAESGVGGVISNRALSQSTQVPQRLRRWWRPIALCWRRSLQSRTGRYVSCTVT